MKTIVLDLDDTLVKTSREFIVAGDMEFSYEDEHNSKYTVIIIMLTY